MRNILRIVALLSLACALACASGSAKKNGGFRVLEAVVIERESERGYAGAMIYTMGFEARDGEATSHMRYEVTKDQFFRYQEGTHVKLYLADGRLRDIKAAD